MKIVLYPHPALLRKSVPVTSIDQNLRDNVAQMFELMYAARGIGLASNQVALPHRFFVINLAGNKEEKSEELVFINPEIIKRAGSEEDEEGCLSVPELYGPVKRSTSLTVEAYGLDGKLFRLECDGLAARAIQHETDHLDGIMFFDRMTPAALSHAQPFIDDFIHQFRQKQTAGLIPSDEDLAAEFDRQANAK
jgi:peptide deformylase